MAITVRGQGYPLRVVAVDDNRLIFTMNEGASAALTSASMVSADTMSATSFSGSIATSAGGTDFAFTAAGGSATQAGGDTITADNFLRVTFGGVSKFIPCFNTIALS